MRNMTALRKPRIKMADGGNMIGLLSSIIDATNNSPDGKLDTGSSFISGALKGGAAGMALGPIGAVVGGLGSGLVSSLQAKKNNAMIDNKANAEAIAYKSAEQNRMNNAVRLANTTNGVTGYYAKGGVMSTIAPNVQEAIGAKHTEGGIDVPTPTGQTANIEGGEVVKDGNYVFSDQLTVPDGSNKTFAEIASGIAKSSSYRIIQGKREVANNLLSNPRGNQFAKNAATRTLEKEVDPLDGLFKLQEQMKAAQQQAVDAKIQQEQANAQSVGQPTVASNPDEEITQPPTTDGDPPHMGIGGDMMQVAGKVGNKLKEIDWQSAAPYIDNLVNAKLNNKSPEIPTPTYTQSPTINTRYSIDAPLNAMKAQGVAQNKTITDNTSNSSIARLNSAGIYGKQIEASNQLYGTKINAETELANKQVELDYANTNRNAQLKDAYNMNNFKRTNDMQARTSANVANAVTDFEKQGAEKNKKIADQQALALTYAKYNDTGVLDRAGVQDLITDIGNGMSYKDAVEKRRRKGNKEFSQIDKRVDMTPRSMALPTMLNVPKPTTPAFEFDKKNIQGNYDYLTKGVNTSLPVKEESTEEEDINKLIKAMSYGRYWKK